MKTITTEEFDTYLYEEVKRATANELLSISGIYEILSEHYNNNIITDFEDDNRGIS